MSCTPVVPSVPGALPGALPGTLPGELPGELAGMIPLAEPGLGEPGVSQTELGPTLRAGIVTGGGAGCATGCGSGVPCAAMCGRGGGCEGATWTVFAA